MGSFPAAAARLTADTPGACLPAPAGELLEQFIKKYVQCYSCGNPETVIKVAMGLRGA